MELELRQTDVVVLFSEPYHLLQILYGPAWRVDKCCPPYSLKRHSVVLFPALYITGISNRLSYWLAGRFHSKHVCYSMSIEQWCSRLEHQLCHGPPCLVAESRSSNWDLLQYLQWQDLASVPRIRYVRCSRAQRRVVISNRFRN